MKSNIISYLHLEQGFTRGSPSGPVTLSDRYREISGQEFYAAAVSFAGRLYRQWIWNRPVVVRAEHRLETLVLFLGALLSGNYYVPLPEDLPGEKEGKILGQLQAGRVYGCGDVRFTDEPPPRDLLEGLGEARRRLPEDAVLYVVFTSGSTGEPKGIVKSHKSMAAFLESYHEAFTFSEGDVVANQTPFCFDASARDFYLMLRYRMDFHIVDGAMFFRPLELVRFLNERRVTLLQWVPSALCMLSRLKAFDREVPGYLRQVFFVGEAFPAGQLAYWQGHLPNTVFVNLYGASEMAGVCCYFTVPACWKGEAVPVGKPLPGQKVYLAGEKEVITESGMEGELCVESATLAEGYLGKDMETADVFVSTLAEGLPAGRYYRTGDIAKYDGEGNLCFVSRKDFQIKHMGHRIEPGEIENAAESVDGVDRAGVVCRDGRICLYYQGAVERRELQALLKERLQPYMLPHKITAVESLPLNRSGKTDYAALREM